jgi:hypothetical protein
VQCRLLTVLLFFGHVPIGFDHSQHTGGVCGGSAECSWWKSASLPPNV